jgi:hypothetical protein
MIPASPPQLVGGRGNRKMTPAVVHKFTINNSHAKLGNGDDIEMKPDEIEGSVNLMKNGEMIARITSDGQIYVIGSELKIKSTLDTVRSIIIPRPA